ncbi:YwmB family TATA-box binding protein [Bacillus sp. SM2101]|uniref:YwmB family TATA-box binding protein n=1 Tax=Bacillus sp. SM2101 TaxID=2805366 RepID=UPI001BDEA857|nr:YwmB family TATA-box binding protein [Bacillus sp. SM2101]
MKNKLHKICMLFIVMILLSIYGNSMTSANESVNKLEEIANVYENNHITIEEWSLYSRQALEISDQVEFEQRIEELKEKTGNFNWDISESSNKWEAVGTFEHLEKNQTEIVKLISSYDNGHRYSYLFYEVKGNHTDWTSVNSTTKNRIADIFTDDVTIFTCIKGYLNDKIEEVLYKRADKILQQFNARAIEALNEETFVSISAYTDDWKDIIPTKTEPINIQVALRSTGLGGRTNVVVGTPIITSEY